MEQRRDEQLHCADCSASFVFSANEAAVFADRGLTPPKRCKNCRRARKDRVSGDGSPGYGRDGAPRQAAPRRYTGDVNEYRSPMADGFFASPHGMPSRGGQWQGSGEYRSPMANGNVRQGPDAGAPNRAPRFRPASPQERGARPRGPGAGHAGDDRRPPRGQTTAASTGPQTGPSLGAEKAPRKRRAAELFSITCTTCGAQADVPFKPAEGREVYCPTCYRARRPAS